MGVGQANSMVHMILIQQQEQEHAVSRNSKSRSDSAQDQFHSEQDEIRLQVQMQMQMRMRMRMPDRVGRALGAERVAAAAWDRQSALIILNMHLCIQTRSMTASSLLVPDN